jgi:hypothetical protein
LLVNLVDSMVARLSRRDAAPKVEAEKEVQGLIKCKREVQQQGEKRRVRRTNIGGLRIGRAFKPGS